jgi:hypothetical protein
VCGQHFEITVSISLDALADAVVWTAKSLPSRPLAVG